MRRLPPRPVPLAGVLCALLVASPAAAQPAVDTARYDIRTYSEPSGGLQIYTTPGTYTTANGAATVRVQTVPFTLITARATTPTLYDANTARARILYSFRILGAPGTRVGATLTADLFGTVVGLERDERTVAESRFQVAASNYTAGFYDPDGNKIFRLDRSLRDGVSVGLPGGGPGYTARFNTPVGFMVDANVQYDVLLEAIAQTATPGVVVDASLDPTITIDPAAQGAYTLVLSPGVSNLAPTATVPEPSTWVLVGTGLAVVGGAARRHRASATA